MASLGTCQARTPEGGSNHYLAQRARKKSKRWRIDTWNVRSMVDTEGTVAIASRRQDGVRGEERKVDLIVREMKRYKVKVVGLQETKWFGCDA